MNGTIRDLFFVLCAAALTSAWWAASMFAVGEGRIAFVPVAMITLVCTFMFFTLHMDEDQ